MYVLCNDYVHGLWVIVNNTIQEIFNYLEVVNRSLKEHSQFDAIWEWLLHTDSERRLSSNMTLKDCRHLYSAMKISGSEPRFELTISYKPETIFSAILVQR
ncbi:hypothetical protein TNCT_243321 [Trichonephila clavata]|uniref:Uncharacterized protein n=1 Tax=Trichonephila clavata TaxID=2740835 RepID=A0A8X6H457_TRICU|nr:hypothetical protein TNCT_243321 [Trichonephila clavata]